MGGETVSTRVETTPIAAKMAGVLGGSALARAQGSFAAAFTAEWAFTVGLGLVAFADGGADGVGLVAVLRLLPAAVLAPLVGALSDRLPREQILAGSSLIRGTATLGAAVALAIGAPHALVYALAVVSTIAFTPFRAAHSALIPMLCRSTDELTMATVVRGASDSISVMLGPFIAAALVGLAGVWAVFAFAGVAGLGSALLLVGVHCERSSGGSGTARRIAGDLLVGLRAVWQTPGLALVPGLMTLQTAIRGALTVFVVVVAIDLLRLGQSGVGWLQGALGVGALAGSIAVRRLVGSPAMARWLGVGVIVWGVPLTLIGVLPDVTVALVAIALIGVGNAIVDVSGFSLPARMVPDDVLARIYGVMESLFAVGVAVGALVTPIVIHLVGVRAALIAIGLVAPLCVAAVWARLAGIDRDLQVRTADIALLRQIDMLRPLPVPVIEELARNLDRRELPAGTPIVTAGELGDRFFVIADGRVDVLDGSAVVRSMGPGEAFGEIALLRHVPRTMTVTAADNVVLRTLGQAGFLAAVTGFRQARSAADETVSRRLSDAPGRSDPRNGPPAA